MNEPRIDDEAERYRNLTPEQILDAVEAAGFACDGRLLALNSYENRVYQVGIDEAPPLIAKFYRPARWSDEAIVEEHAFAAELADAEIPVVAPLADGDGRTLHRHGPFRFALFPRVGGRAPEPSDLDQLTIIGRFLGRIHAVGAQVAFHHRPSLDVDSFGVEAASFVLASGMLPAELGQRYRAVTSAVVDKVRECYQRAGTVTLLRCHGDAHIGNILVDEQRPHIVDLDDARMAPAVQDLWMLLAGDRGERAIGLDALLEGYHDFHEFAFAELHLVEALRSLRLVHYHAWLARRWDDPAFPLAFPWFNTPRAWQQHLADLEDQLEAMDETPLSLGG